MQERTKIEKLEVFEMAKVDVIEERLNNHIKFFWTIIGAGVLALSFMALELYRINAHLGELDGLKEKVTKIALQTQTVAGQSVFESNLADLRSAVADAREGNVRVAPKVIDELQKKLLATRSDAPDFWPTISEFISYRSSLSYRAAAASTPVKPWVFAAAKIIPDCADSPPKPMTVKEVLSPNQLTSNPGIYENCRLILDSAKQDGTINAILQKYTPFLKFKNCLIEYHGGEINLILAWDKAPFRITLQGKTPEEQNKTVQTVISGPAIQFENCLFSFSFQTMPPARGQQISTTLLAENANSFSLPIARSN